MNVKVAAVVRERYWSPLYAHVRRQEPTPEDAQDLTRACLAPLAGDWLLNGFGVRRA